MRADRWPYYALGVGVAVIAVAVWLGLGGTRTTSPPPSGPATPAAATVTDAGPPAVVVPPPAAPANPATATYPRVRWHHAVAVGPPWKGRLRDGVLLPAYGEDYVTWDPPLLRYPNRVDRRWGTARLIQTLLYVLHQYRRAHPHAPRVLVGDLSRPHGGPFTSQHGGLGHASHQNGLDVDVLYPRKDGQELPAGPKELDHRLSQDLVDRFVRAFAQYVFVGPHTGLGGPRGTVQQLVNHDDHMHVRIYPRGDRIYPRIRRFGPPWG